MSLPEPRAGRRPGAPTLTVGAVDRFPLFAEGVRALIRRRPDLGWVGAAGSHGGALKLCQAVRPVVLLVDSALDPKGYLSHAVLGQGMVRAVVAVVDPAHRTNRYLDHVRHLGIKVFVAREFDSFQLDSALGAACHGDGFVPPALQRACRNDAALKQELSARQVEILGLMSEGKPRAEIARSLSLSVETVNTHIQRVKQKLQVRNSAHAVSTAIRSGLIESAKASRLPEAEGEVGAGSARTP